MNIGIFIRLLLCIVTVGCFLYSYISKQNTITKLRLEIPAASKELGLIQDENIRLQYEIDKFENPAHLMELSKKPEYSHLKYPSVEEIITLPLPEMEEK